MGLISELRRRNVFRVGTFYVVSAWVLLQAAELVFGILEFPEQALKWVFGLLALGAPVALFLAWVYEWTPDGLKPDPGPGSRSQTNTSSARRVDFVIIALLVVAVAYFSVDKFVLQRSHETAVPVTNSEFERSVAALPFLNHGDDSDSAAFASGIHDDLLTQMSKIAELRVISNATMRNYADTTKTVPQIAQELSVKHILEGGVQRSGDRIRVNVQLIDATTDKHLWAETYDRELTIENIFEIQTNIVGEITRNLRVALGSETSKAISTLPTNSLEAYRDYVAAMTILDQSVGLIDAQATRQEIEFLKAAVARDPKFALAWAKLAEVLRALENPINEMLQISAGISAHDALAKAEEIDPNLPEVHYTRAYFARLENRFEDALAELDKAEQGMPSNADVLRFRYWILRRMGRNDEALASIKRALSLDPQNIRVIEHYGQALMESRRFDEARAHFKTAMDTFPDRWDLREELAYVDALQYGDFRPTLDVWLAPDAPADSPTFNIVIAWMAWTVGDLQSAVEFATQLTRDFNIIPQAYVPAPEFKAWIFRDAGMDAEANQAALLARQKILEKQEQHPNEPLVILALARMNAFFGDYTKAIELAEDSARIAQSHPAYRDKLNEIQFRAVYGQTLCSADDLPAAEDVWRAILSEENSFTLASLIEGWPPCKKLMLGTENYNRLEADFGHLSHGMQTPAN